MPAEIISESEFIAIFEAHGGGETAKRLGMSPRDVFQRRRRLEKKLLRTIVSPTASPNPSGKAFQRVASDAPGRVNVEVDTGVVLVGSDAHYWPDIISTAHRAFVQFCKDLTPKIVILNGDEMDGASISRHPPIGWEKNPSVIQEIEACQERLGEIEAAAPKAKRFWNLGNHDARFSTRLAAVAPEYANVHGTSLKDHFPAWDPCWSVWINDDVVVKHRFKGGIHATHNNTLWAGKTIVTGHLHSLKVTPLTDYNGTKYGVDTGCIADAFGPQFEYLEDNPRNWRSGFVVLTFYKGRLLWPDVAHVFDDGVLEFRGAVYNV